ncbi:hypothetical protein BsWGS_23137 [Bradybaena similaris]
MEYANNVIYQGEFYKLNESRKRLIRTKADTWKPKYLIFYHKDDKPVLEYHKRKPKNGKKSERTLTESFELWPSYKVEKLHNARGRAFVCEITSADFHIFLSADEEKQIDVLVFLLQIQIRLKENIKKEYINVVPDDSESHQKIGAKGSKCVLHVSPWGLTLVLEQTRALLAQWPLKSIRYYEASGAGNFSIEAGRVAPMGEGLFSFKTQPGEDDFMYNLIDSYIVNTLDRVKPTQKGTPEEIEDYIREHDCLHSLTDISVCSPQNYEIRKVLKRNWGISLPTPEDLTSSASPEAQTSSPRHRRSGAHVSQSPSTNRPVQSSSLVINLERPGETSENRRHSSESHTSRGRNPDARVTVRPPPPPSRSSNSGVPRRSQRREHSIPRKIDVVGTKSEGRTRVVLSESAGTGSVTPPLSDSRLSSESHSVTGSESPHPAGTSISESDGHRHTEFYNLSSPHIKVRVSKSPIITRNPNKVGRAEYLLSVQQSGVRTPASAGEGWDFKSAAVGEDDHQQAAEYLNEISKASRNKYGGQHAVDNQAGSKLRHEMSASQQSLSSTYSSMEFPAAVAAQARPHGYANLQSSPSREIHHGRQRSAPETMLQTAAPWELRHKSEDSGSDLSPSMIRQKKKYVNEDRVSYVVPSSLTPVNAEDKRPHSSGTTRRKSAESHSQNTVSDTRTYRKDSDVLDTETLSRGSDVLDTGTLSRASDVLRSDLLRDRQGIDRNVTGTSEASNSVDDSVSEWLISASCEDLSDHMRTVIYNDKSGGDSAEGVDEVDVAQVDKGVPTVSSSPIGASSDKPPLPFPGLKKFHDHTGTVGYSRDRSKSFGYMNIPGDIGAQGKPQSSAPSAHLIRKMVNARAHQETLRKSLSNPNFLNLGSKEHLFSLKTTNGAAVKLAPQQRQKSKSFGSLFPAIKKALSRESLGHSRSTTPERRSSRSTTPERRSSLSARRSSNDADSNFRRQASFHSFGEMTIKGIRMTERSRSFRRVRGARSMELLSRPGDETDISRLSSATTLSSPPTAGSETHTSTVDPGQTSASAASTESSTESSTVPASVSYPSSLSSVHLTLTASSLPPLPAPVNPSSLPTPANPSPFSSPANQPPPPTPINPPPPIPAPRKRVSAEETLQISRSTSGNFHESTSYQNTISVEQNSTQNQHQRVSDIILKNEGNAADQALQSDSKHGLQTDIPTGGNTISTRPSNAGQTQKRRISSSQGTATNPTHTVTDGLEHQKSGNLNRAVDYQGHKFSPVGLQMNLRETKASSLNENENNNSQLNEPRTNKLPSMPKPFQPIPFRKHQNGIRSVQAPSRPSKP